MIAFASRPSFARSSACYERKTRGCFSAQTDGSVLGIALVDHDLTGLQKLDECRLPFLAIEMSDASIEMNSSSFETRLTFRADLGRLGLCDRDSHRAQ
jgi:hypothetical protein